MYLTTLSPANALSRAYFKQSVKRESFTNDSNTLNKEFYNELLHIVGIEESNRRIIRKRPEKRDDASLLENTMNILSVRNKSGITEQDTYSIALELCITWLNRILFLKLLECQIIRYRNASPASAFLNAKTIRDFSELDELFFEILAVPAADRAASVREKFGNIPYLNSSLFEISEAESRSIQISALKDRLQLSLFSQTVLKDSTGKRISGRKNTLHYLFEFLDAYDFSSESGADIQEENKTIINASVPGLIFEKINGYKDGAFFTPGFVTMYMCRETIRRAVIGKFNAYYGWNCSDMKEIYNKIDDLCQANLIIDSLKICDPAVGSGHFLVSALNEMIAVKSELGILADRNGKRLRDYYARVENDELIIYREDGMFRYNFRDPESRRVQETVFHEKQKIIGNCLFGVDINPKSVLICRLRLWIELLKNTYYKAPDFEELETFPNIDMNIKCENFLTSCFEGNFIGFDVVIGNPPYGISFTEQEKQYFKEKYDSAKTITGQQKGSLDSFSLFIDKGLSLCGNNALLAYIVSMSLMSGESMTALHNVIFKICETIYISAYSNRPQKIFERADQRTAIMICHKNNKPTQKLYTTKVNKRYKDTSAQEIVNNLEFINSYPFVKYGRIPKIGTDIEAGILQKLFSLQTTLHDLFDKNGLPIYYRAAGGRYYNIITNFPTNSTQEKILMVRKEYRDLIGAILSSNLYYWFCHIYSDNLHIKSYELEIFPIPISNFRKQNINIIDKLYSEYLTDLNKNSRVKKANYNTIDAYREYYSKSLSNPPNPPAPFPEREGGRHHRYSPLLSGEGPGEGCFDSESVLCAIFQKFH